MAVVVGQPVTVTASYRDTAGALTDPDAVTLTTVAPDGTATTGIASTTAATGEYSATFTPLTAGRWQWWFVAVDGATTSASEADIVNVETVGTTALISLADAKSAIRQIGGYTADDAQLLKYIEAATPVIEDLCGDVIPRTRTYSATGGRSAIVLPQVPTSITTVTAGGVEVEATAYTVDLDAGIVYSGTTDGVTAFAYGHRNVDIVYRTGYEVTPANLILAAQEHVRLMWQSTQQGSPRPGLGGEPTETPGGLATWASVVNLCQPHVRLPGIA